jgi:hypothetical protein
MFTRTDAITRLANPVVFILSISVGVPSLSVAENATLTSSGTDLPQLLDEQGWQEKTEADGSTLFYPPAQKARPSARAAHKAAARSAIPDIYQQLRELGWEIHTDAEGNTLLIPVDQSTRSPAKSHPVSPPVVGAESSAGASSTVPPDVEALLRERGWRIETDAAGNTLLVPTGSVPSDTAESDTAHTPDPFLQFRQLLEDKGWRVEPAEDGAAIIYPPVKADNLRADRGNPLPDKRSHCQWIELEAVANGEIELPVDNQSKARKLATVWIDSYGRPGLAVGKVRRINRLYAVSVVETETPYQLRNQLIIRSDNGRVIAID